MKVEKESPRGTGSKQLLVGIGEVVVHGFNFNREKSNEFFGYETKDTNAEIEYLKEVEVKNGDDSQMVNQMTVSVFVEEKKTKTRHKINFYIKDIVAKTKDGLKTQFVNQHGDSTYVDAIENLNERFTTLKVTDKNDSSLNADYPKEYRAALNGEAQLLDFISRWMDLNKWKITNNILLDMKKLMKGNVSELSSMVEDYTDYSVLVPFGVKSKEKDGETKQYQVVSSKFFLQGRFLKNYNNYLKSNFEGLTKATKYMYDLWNFHKNLTDSQYGFDKEADFLVLDLVRPYVDGESPLQSNEAVISETGADY